MVLDALCVWLSLILAARLRPSLSSLDFLEPLEGPLQLPAAVVIALPLVWIMIYSALSIYDGRRYLRAVDEFSALTFAIAVSSVCSAGILYLTYREISRALFLSFVLFAYVLGFGWRILIRVIWRSGRDPIEPARRVVIVGIGPLGQRVREQLQRVGNSQMSVVGMIDDRPGAGTADSLVLGGREVLRDSIRTRRVSDVVVALPHSAYGDLASIVGLLDDLPVRVWVALGFFDLALYKTGIEDMEGIPMLDLRASAIDEYQRMIKRGFDVVVGSLMLVLCLPLIAVSAILVLLDDGPPLLFTQQRVGENGRVFRMLKMRTMVKNAEGIRSAVEEIDTRGNTIHKRRDDPRVTRAGRLLRRLSLDELPQLLNVLKGQMSLVGPRPELPYLVEQYQPWQRKRFAVPPGMTGWWQVRGRSSRPMHLNTEDDLYYVQNYTIWLDLEILVRTIWVVLLGKGAY